LRQAGRSLLRFRQRRLGSSLMSYGADPRESFDRAAALAARIFEGAKPTDLPFELPTRYLLVIN
jgi:putative ABC transport system substrate-binding protein